MLAGHIGVAAGAKRWAPQVPIWALLVASFLQDILFLILWALGVERMWIPDGNVGGYGKLAYQIDWSHSFLGTLILCFLVVLITDRWWGARGAFILSALVFSHWFLDLIVHTGDIAMLPGNFGGVPRVGIGLWDAPLAAMLLELILVLAGSWLWHSAPGIEQKSRRSALITGAIGIIVLVLDFIG